MVSAELIVVGGFLGAGKTTSILSIAKYLISSGKKVGIVTNDQGSELVDTNFSRKNIFKSSFHRGYEDSRFNHGVL
ncbi:CobW-like GTP-binding protein [Clostridium estertheticum]|uniref:GTP-binding protein n=1 Tax=Clostridium estertheticum TaxID=238834 RepID=UPI0016524292|nr:GTP-binding protein [Clostridium estertheticum]MBZ9686026.1 CobW-like GTP-binding protein [Clostridium estertheticum]